MTEIRDDHVAWAVVHRMRLILDGPSVSNYSVTEAYAFFTAVLCWCLEHIRRPKNAKAQATLKSLEDAGPRDDPWRISHDGRGLWLVGHPKRNPKPITSAAQALIWLRDTVAHGDGKKIMPIHKAGMGGRRVLTGFRFDDAVTLTEHDMRRIGCALADLFCNEIGRGEQGTRDGLFELDALNRVSEAHA